MGERDLEAHSSSLFSKRLLESQMFIALELLINLFNYCKTKAFSFFFYFRKLKSNF